MKRIRDGRKHQIKEKKNMQHKDECVEEVNTL